MATLHEYFIKDGSRDLTMHETWDFSDQTGQILGQVIARLHFDFPAYALYVSFYIPDMSGVECPEAILLNDIPKILKKREEVLVQQGGFGEDDEIDGRELMFTGQVYLYSERPVAPDLKRRIIEEARKINHHLTFRSTTYMTERNKWERPRAFISHDGRDKKEIAEPIALQLQKWMCPVWFDQYSLRVGDSLRGSIEAGLKECDKCILILTPNFLNNEGWTKREYDSIFTRELVEKKKVILPVWHNVSAEDVYKYSPILADRVGAQWSSGVEDVARKLLIAIDARK